MSRDKIELPENVERLLAMDEQVMQEQAKQLDIAAGAKVFSEVRGAVLWAMETVRIDSEGIDEDALLEKCGGRDRFEKMMLLTQTLKNNV